MAGPTKADLEIRLADAQREIEHLQREASTYKTKVREVAIDVADEQGWCASGLNNRLEELGLEGRTYRYLARVTVPAEQTVTIPIQAADEDAVRDKIYDMQNAELKEYINAANWMLGEFEMIDAVIDE